LGAAGPDGTNAMAPRARTGRPYHTDREADGRRPGEAPDGDLIVIPRHRRWARDMPLVGTARPTKLRRRRGRRAGPAASGAWAV
jgi:hypothetical protein